MRWRDLNYLCHGLEAEVIFDDRQTIADTPKITRIHGTIECNGFDVVPRLRLAGSQNTMVFHDALVLLIPPKGRSK